MHDKLNANYRWDRFDFCAIQAHRSRYALKCTLVSALWKIPPYLRYQKIEKHVTLLLITWCMVSGTFKRLCGISACMSMLCWHWSFLLVSKSSSTSTTLVRVFIASTVWLLLTVYNDEISKYQTYRWLKCPRITWSISRVIHVHSTYVSSSNQYMKPANQHILRASGLHVYEF